jgi:hypothetical protein
MKDFWDKVCGFLLILALILAVIVIIRNLAIPYEDIKALLGRLR